MISMPGQHERRSAGERHRARLLPLQRAGAEGHCRDPTRQSRVLLDARIKSGHDDFDMVA
jgi:hypothetical protein